MHTAQSTEGVKVNSKNGSASLREGQPHVEKERSKEELLVPPEVRGFWKGSKKQKPVRSSVVPEGGTVQMQLPDLWQGNRQYKIPFTRMEVVQPKPYLVSVMPIP